MNCRKILLVGIISLFSVGCFYSCEKEDVYKAVVTVSMLEMVDEVTAKKIPVPSCKLVFGEENFSPEIKRTGYTDVAGKYESEWQREVSLRVYASKEIDGVMYVGASVVRLTAEGVATQEILITQEN